MPKRTHLTLLIVFSLLLSIPIGCDDPTAPEQQPFGGFESDVRHIDLGREAELLDGVPAGEELIISGRYLDTDTGFLLRVTATGIQRWLIELTHVGTDLDIADDGTILVAGTTADSAAWFERYSDSGSRISQTTLDNLEARAIRSTADGGIALVANNAGEIEFLRFSATGMNLWHRVFSGSQIFSAMDLIVFNDGFLVAAQGGVGDIAIPWLLIETDADGNETQQYAFSNSDEIFAITKLVDDNWLMLGTTAGADSHARLLRSNENGELAWDIPFTSMVFPRALHVMENGDTVVTGLSLVDGNTRPLIQIIDANGEVTDMTFTLQTWESPSKYIDETVLCVGVRYDGELAAIGAAPIAGANGTCVYFYEL
jgi:hypothetical protein